MAITATQLAAFAAVARHGGVQAAADELRVTQPSVSSAVAGLGRALGLALLEREGRGVRLSPAGQAFAPYAEAALGMVEQGRQAAREAVRPEAARVRVIAVPTAGEYLMPALIKAYRAVEPGATVLLEVGNRREVVEALRRGRADVGIAGRAPAHDLVAHPLVDNDLLVVGMSQARDLSAATWLLREEGSGTRATLEAYLVQQGIVPREQLTLGSNGAIRQALAVGLGVSLISRHAVAAELAAGTLQVLDAPGTPIRRPFHVLIVRTPPPRPAARRLVEFLRSEAARAALSE
jgi:LysR family transcriptional regulator, low CO2-responsive transcriptional regulator